MSIGVDLDVFQDEYLSNPSDVLHAILRGEAKIFVQAKSYIISIQSVRLQAEVEQMLFECSCNCRLARGGETGEPDCAAFLLSKLTAFLASEACVPCDVAGFMSAQLNNFFIRLNSKHLANLRCHFTLGNIEDWFNLFKADNCLLHNLYKLVQP